MLQYLLTAVAGIALGIAAMTIETAAAAVEDRIAPHRRISGIYGHTLKKGINRRA